MTRTFKTGLLIAGRMTNVALFIGLLACLSRLLPKQTYGAFAWVLVVYQLSSTVFVVGLPQSVFYFLPRYDGLQRRTFMVQTLALLSAQGGIVTLALYFGADGIADYFKNPELSHMLRIFAPYTIFMLPFYAMDATMLTANRPLTAVGFAVLSRAAAFVAVVVPVALGGGILLGIRMWVLAAIAECAVAVAVLLKYVGGVSLHNWWRILKEQVHYALPVGGAVLLGALAGYADKTVVNRLFGPAAYAGYFNGAMELPVVGILTGAVASVMFPEMVLLIKEGRYGELRQLWYRAIQRTNTVLLPFLGALMFVAPELMVVMFGQQYRDSAAYFRVFLLTLPARVVLYGPLAMSLGANTVFLRSQAIATAIAVGGCAMLAWITRLPVFVAFGAIAGIYAGFLYAAWALSKRMGIRTREFLPLKHLLSVLTVSLICGAFAWVVSWPLRGERFGHSLLRLGCSTAVFGICYLMATQRLGLADWRSLIRLITGSRDKPARSSTAS